jgi:hypothetical protein
LLDRSKKQLIYERMNHSEVGRKMLEDMVVLFACGNGFFNWCGAISTAI